MKKAFNLTNWHVFYYLGLLFLLTFSNNIRAQEQSGLSFGIKGGLASGTFTTQNRLQVGSAHMGMQIGTFVNYNVMEFLGVSMEVLYSNTGATNVDPEYFYALENATSSQRIVNTSVVSHQISIPILISYIFPEMSDGVSPKIYVGGDMSFNLLSNSQNTFATSFKSNTIYSTEYTSMGNRLAKNDFGLIIGTGITLGSGAIVYTFDARYRLGLSNINEAFSSYANSDLKRDIFSLMIGVAYKL